jgi:hypothetical protein
MMSQPLNLTNVVSAVLRQLPQWIRTDLASKDAALRERAEDALAAIVASAVADAG